MCLLWLASNDYYVIRYDIGSRNAYTPFLVAYAAGALLLAFAVHRRRALREPSFWAIPLFDSPMIFLTAWFGFLLSQNPGATGAFQIGLFSIALMYALLTLRAEIVIATASVSYVFQMILLREVGLGSVWLTVLVIMAVPVGIAVESLTKEHHRTILASEATRRAAGDAFQWEAAPDTPVKGKTEPLRIFSPSA